MTTTENPMQLATTDTLRTANVHDLVTLLHAQRDINHDMVCEPGTIEYRDGLLVANNAGLADISISEDGELRDTVAPMLFRPTAGFEQDVSEKLGIPAKYMQKLRADAIARVDELGHEAAYLLDHNVNHWLAQQKKPVLVRAFHTGAVADLGIARALRSDQFGMYDHLDILLAGLSGVKEAGVDEFEIAECRLTEKQMHVRIKAPSISAAAPTWLKGYRSPFSDDGGSLERAEYGFARNPGGAKRGDLVCACVDLRNSETGDGSWYIAPAIEVFICGNGQTIKRDAFTRTHLGSKLSPGIVRYSDETHKANIDLIKLESRDAVRTFLDIDYLAKIVGEIEEKAGAPVKDVEGTITLVAKTFGFSDEEEQSILAAFIGGGQVNAGGILNAVTAAAQTLSNADRVVLLEEKAFDVLNFVAAAS